MNVRPTYRPLKPGLIRSHDALCQAYNACWHRTQKYSINLMHSNIQACTARIQSHAFRTPSVAIGFEVKPSNAYPSIPPCVRSAWSSMDPRT